MWVNSRRRPSNVSNFSADGTRVDAWRYFPDFKVGNYIIPFLLLFTILLHDFVKRCRKTVRQLSSWNDTWVQNPVGFNWDLIFRTYSWQESSLVTQWAAVRIFIGLIRDPPQANPNLRLDFPSRRLSVRPMLRVKVDSKWTDFNSSFENVNLPWKDIHSGKLCHSESRAGGGLGVFG
jgi:hypothetical protein